MKKSRAKLMPRAIAAGERFARRAEKLPYFKSATEAYMRGWMAGYRAHRNDVGEPLMICKGCGTLGPIRGMCCPDTQHVPVGVLIRELWDIAFPSNSGDASPSADGTRQAPDGSKANLVPEPHRDAPPDSQREYPTEHDCIMREILGH